MAAALPFGDLVDALHDAFAVPAETPLRHHHALNDGAMLLLMPSWQGRYVGVKIVTVHPRNAARGLPAVHATYVLSDLETGAPVALLDGDVLTARRTAAASALAARFLVRADAARLLVVGAGRVASLLAQAHAATWAVGSVEIWNRTSERSERLAEALRRSGMQARRVDDLRGAVERADVVSCATLAATPLIEGGWLRPGTHVDLVGAYTPAMREADAAALDRASVFADTEAALSECGELAGWTRNRLTGTLVELCRGEVPGRRSATEITLFKSVGTGLEDLAAATLAVSGKIGAAGPGSAAPG